METLEKWEQCLEGVAVYIDEELRQNLVIMETSKKTNIIDHVSRILATLVNYESLFSIFGKLALIYYLEPGFKLKLNYRKFFSSSVCWSQQMRRLIF